MTAIVTTKPTASETSLDERQQIIALTQHGLSAPAIARAFGCSERTVRRWRARHRQAGPVGLAYHTRRPLTPHPQTTPPAVVARIHAIRQAHPQWGARLIHRQLRLEGVAAVPGEHTVQHWLARLGFGSVRPPRGKRLGWRQTPPAPDASVWEVDFTKKRGRAT